MISADFPRLAKLKSVCSVGFLYKIIYDILFTNRILKRKNPHLQLKNVVIELLAVVNIASS